MYNKGTYLACSMAAVEVLTAPGLTLPRTQGELRRDAGRPTNLCRLIAWKGTSTTVASVRTDPQQPAWRTGSPVQNRIPLL